MALAEVLARAGDETEVGDRAEERDRPLEERDRGIQIPDPEEVRALGVETDRPQLVVRALLSGPRGLPADTDAPLEVAEQMGEPRDEAGGGAPAAQLARPPERVRGSLAVRDRVWPPAEMIAMQAEPDVRQAERERVAGPLGQVERLVVIACREPEEPDRVTDVRYALRILRFGLQVWRMDDFLTFWPSAGSARSSRRPRRDLCRRPEGTAWSCFLGELMLLVLYDQGLDAKVRLFLGEPEVTGGLTRLGAQIVEEAPSG